MTKRALPARTPTAELNVPAPPSPEDLALETLWSGETAFAVDKPAGWLVHNSSFAGPKERSLRQVIGQAMGRRVFPVHRLDRGTSGVLWFARESEHVAAWQAALEADDASKLYFALVRGRFQAPQHVDYPVKDANGVPRDARSQVLPVAVSPVERVSLVALLLHTGRHHQARRHMAHLRHPIVNDSRHGDSKFNRALRATLGMERLALHCAAIRCIAPESAAGTLTVQAPLDATFSAACAHLFPAQTDAGAALAKALRDPMKLVEPPSA